MRKPVVFVGMVFLLLLAACTFLPTPATSPSSPAPTPKVEPSASPTPPVVPTGTPVPPAITLVAPRPGETVSSPVEVRGSVAVSPFESTLLGRVYDAAGQVVGSAPIMVAAEMGQPGTFVGTILFVVDTPGPGRVEVAELSAKDGSVVVQASVDVLLQPTRASAVIEMPVEGARATLPLHILARLGRPGEEVVVSLRWQDGTVLERSYTLRAGEDGRGLLIESLWWQADVPPPMPPTQPAVLEIRRPGGTSLARRELTLLNWDDPDVTVVTLYFLLGEELTPVQVHIPKTVRIGTAALEELLWGPPAYDLAGLGTAIPTPDQVLSYPGRGADWGCRVRLLGLTIQDGVARADFSREMKAYGGGSARVWAIRQQISRTLLEFPTVREVAIAVEGETEGVLEP
ncbi:MAG: Gmad2 immunoglobulin-like domain-containing protein [Chloroflexia bacterium]